jgi:hypothetical protein
MHWAPRHAQKRLKIIFDKEVWFLIVGLNFLIFGQIFTNPVIAFAVSLGVGVAVQRIIDTKPRGYLQHLVHRYIVRLIAGSPAKRIYKP